MRLHIGNSTEEEYCIAHSERWILSPHPGLQRAPAIDAHTHCTATATLLNCYSYTAKLLKLHSYRRTLHPSPSAQQYQMFNSTSRCTQCNTIDWAQLNNALYSIPLHSVFNTSFHSITVQVPVPPPPTPFPPPLNRYNTLRVKLL